MGNIERSDEPGRLARHVERASAQVRSWPSYHGLTGDAGEVERLRRQLAGAVADARMVVEWGEFTRNESAGYWGKDQEAVLERFRALLNPGGR